MRYCAMQLLHIHDLLADGNSVDEIAVNFSQHGHLLMQLCKRTDVVQLIWRTRSLADQFIDDFCAELKETLSDRIQVKRADALLGFNTDAQGSEPLCKVCQQPQFSDCLCDYGDQDDGFSMGTVGCDVAEDFSP